MNAQTASATASAGVWIALCLVSFSQYCLHSQASSSFAVAESKQPHPSGLLLFFPSFLLQEHTSLPGTLASILGYSVIALVKRDAVF